MKRVVYSPKVWAYVKTEKTVVDITDYIVSGSVTRRLNGVSSASISIRNPQRRWTPRTGSPLFRPMDPITIYMMRAPGFPRQVFTGYLDRTPFYQLYPGTVKLEASCTLKRLLYTYFDPGLPYMIEFLGQYGWVNSGNGTFLNPAEIVRTDKKDDGTIEFTDAGFGNVLFGTLNHIGKWKSSSIFIQKLPGSIDQKLGRVFQSFQDTNKESSEALARMLTKIVGASDYGGSGGSVDDPNLRGNKNVEKAFNYLRDKGYTANQAAGAVGSMMGESGEGLSPTAEEGPAPLGYGIAQWSYGRRAKLESRANYKTLEVQLRFLGEELDGPERAARDALKGTSTIEEAVLAWTDKFERAGIRSIDKRTAYARSVHASYANSATGGDTKSDEELNSSASAESRSASTTGDTKDDVNSTSNDKIYAPIASKSATVTSPWGPRNGRNHNGIDVAVPVGTACVAPADGKIGSFITTTGFGEQGGMIHFVFAKDTGDVKAGTVIGWGHVGRIAEDMAPGKEVKAGTVIAYSGYPKAPHVHFIQRGDSSNMDGTVDPQPLYEALMRGETTPTDGGNTGGGSSGAGGMNPTASAFAAEFALPGLLESGESILLQGAKSLMNDQPLMPFVEQLCSASLRQYQSLPNGDFFAFYPDYFGEFDTDQAPYWEIVDTEILDGSIDLNDDNVVTHQYVVGDTIPFGGITLAEKLLSSGVVSIFDIFDANKDDEKDGKEALVGGELGRGREAAMKFMERYGARPNYEEAPFIRSPYFELFLAYQRWLMAWSSQFSTNFAFTFMPELWPGGKVGFRDHGIKMFIEEVTHNFDYTSGFTTTATLSAPAAYNRENQTLPIPDGLVRNA